MTLTSRASAPPLDAFSLLADPAADIRDEIAAANGMPELADKIWFHKTASAVIDAGRCVGCGSCIAACPSRSIGVGEDGRPTLVRMCTGCSACWDYCPLAGLRVERLGLDTLAADGSPTDADGSPTDADSELAGLGLVRAAYSARAARPADRAQDGGVVTGLLAELLDLGYVDGVLVTRRVDAFRGEPYVALSADAVREAAGTVYHQSHALGALNDPLPAGVKRLAFVGTPCQVSGLRALQRFPWRYRRSTAGAVVLAVALFCTRSFEPRDLELAVAGSGVDTSRVARIDIRGAELVARGRGAEVLLRRPVRDFRHTALKGCDECADFTGLAADLAMGSHGSEPGMTTVLVRTAAGGEAMERGANALVLGPLTSLEAVASTAARDRRRAEGALERKLDLQGPLWISYTEHLRAYGGTAGRAPAKPPPFRSQHYDVSC